MIYIKVNQTEYPAANNDRAWGNRKSKAVTLEMTHAAAVQWTRTPMKRNTFYVFCLSTDGGLDRRMIRNSDSSRPTFTLPNTFPVIQNPDGTYSPAA